MRNLALATALLTIGCSREPVGKSKRVVSENTPPPVTAQRDVEECKVLEESLGGFFFGELGKDPECLEAVNLAAQLIYLKILKQCILLKPRICDERQVIENTIQEEFDAGTIPDLLIWRIRERVLGLATEQD